MSDGEGTGAELYQDVVMRRARRPLHAGTAVPGDGEGSGTNPLCGDRTRVTLRRDPAGRATEIRHETRGCAICAASADLMAERAEGLDADGVRALSERFERLVSGNGEGGEMGALAVFAELRNYRSRRKCAVLPFSALLAAFGVEDAEAREAG